METTKTMHPDFTKALNDKQVAWLEAHDVDATEDDIAGFYFHKGTLCVEPIRAFDRDVYLSDYSKLDEDGEPKTRIYPRLRDALLVLIAEAA